MNFFNKNPNFSIVLPGGCNSNCSFCFNKGNDLHFKTEELGKYLTNLKDVLSYLPSQFYQISITGGEPTISPYFDAVLALLITFRKKYTNIVLTSNGTNLLDKKNIVGAAVDHINISRHHHDDELNKKIFGGSYELDTLDIAQIIDEYGKRGIDVSLNCVIDDSTFVHFIPDFIGYANYVGAYSVHFRKESGTLDPTSAELAFKDYAIISESSCPVCRTKHQRIKGKDVFWKASSIEPSDKIKDSIYELIFQPDGKVYADWAGNRPLTVAKLADKKRAVSRNEREELPGYYSTGGDCGGGVSSGC